MKSSIFAPLSDDERALVSALMGTGEAMSQLVRHEKERRASTWAAGAWRDLGEELAGLRAEV